MHVGKEHRFQTGEAESRVGEPGPATGNGAPAVPSSTNSVAMLTSSSPTLSFPALSLCSGLVSARHMFA
jgi:hypothetical protein